MRRSPLMGISGSSMMSSSSARRGVFHHDCENYFVTVTMLSGVAHCGYCKGPLSETKYKEFKEKYGPERSR